METDPSEREQTIDPEALEVELVNTRQLTERTRIVTSSGDYSSPKKALIGHGHRPVQFDGDEAVDISVSCVRMDLCQDAPGL